MVRVSGTQVNNFTSNSSGITAFWNIKNQIYYLLILMCFLSFVTQEVKLWKKYTSLQVHGHSIKMGQISLWLL